MYPGVRRGWLIAWVVAILLSPAFAQVELPELSPNAPIHVTAATANRWWEGGYEVWLLRGNCRITQGAATAQCCEAVLWVSHASATAQHPTKVIAYLEGDVAIDIPHCKQSARSDARPPPSAADQKVSGATRLTDHVWFGRFFTAREVSIKAGHVAGKPDLMPAVFSRAVAQFSAPLGNEVRQAQFTSAPSVGPLAPSAAPGPLPPGARRIRAYPRSHADCQVIWYPDPRTQQWIAVITSGVNVIIDGVPLGDTRPSRGGGFLPQYATLDISADRMVIWTQSQEEPDLGGNRPQAERTPLEIYMEGNIVFRQGERVIYAERMYYDVANQVGTVLEAELLTDAPSYEGLLRLKARIVQQMGEGRFAAQDAYITSSLMGRPGYRLQAGDIQFEHVRFPSLDPRTGEPLIDPDTQQPLMEEQQWATTRNNLLFLGPIPVFYWPKLKTDLEDPTYYIRRARVKSDRVFGTQVLTDWSVYELLPFVPQLPGTKWEASFDYLSMRGFGHGTTFRYRPEEAFGLPGGGRGVFDYWGIYDDGHDNLGSDRARLEPERRYRHRLFWQHRQQLPGDFLLSAEAGWLSDRNFLQEFYQREWDELKDQSTGVELKRRRENRSWSITADVRVNEFFTQTDWLPRADHFWLGQPLFQDALTWYEHSSIGYGRFHRASAPIRPNDRPFQYLPWEVTNSLVPGPSTFAGERLVTRQEIDWPFQIGPVKLVPYLLGELAHWGEDLDGNSLQRAYGQAGIRASLPMWRLYPGVENTLWNVHGLAHKVVFDAEMFWAEATRDLDRLPLYDPLDDDAIEALRRRMVGSGHTFPPPLTAIPRQFDERYYAARTAMASWVTAPCSEIADDLMAFRLGAHQRWQTKRGLPEQRHIIDWIVFDTNVTWFPKENRDNFGKAVGLLDYYFRWHVGDRLTLVSDGIFDFFHDGQQIVTVGGFLSRPPRGNLYLGLRLLEGPMHSQILGMSYSYWMSPKWISTFGMSLDLARTDNFGQNFTVTRVGESLLVSAGVNLDPIRNNVGVNFMIEPRFLPKGRLGSVAGARIPPAGTLGLE